MTRNIILNEDCLTALRRMPSDSIDAMVTDPPYGLANTSADQVSETLLRWVSGDREYVPAGRGFMGNSWDAFVPPVAVWDEALRVLKPGGHCLAFSGSRTVDLMMLGIRLAGFEVRDSISWLYGSGFPKSHDVSKAIDKALGAEREPDIMAPAEKVTNNVVLGKGLGVGIVSRGAAGSPEAEAWQGWGTALKPAHEPIVVARKPLVGTVAANVMAHGAGALNIDASRVETAERIASHHGTNGAAGVPYGARRAYIPGSANADNTHTAGRWPPNVVLDEHAAAELDADSGTSSSRAGAPRASIISGDGWGMTATGAEHNDSGGASRFFPTFKYQAKAPTSERPKVDGVSHPTVKPLALMRWLVRLVTPPGGVVLDPFAGSGTTIEAAIQEGFDYLGIERDESYIALIQARIARNA